MEKYTNSFFSETFDYNQIVNKWYLIRPLTSLWFWCQGDESCPSLSDDEFKFVSLSLPILIKWAILALENLRFFYQRNFMSDQVQWTKNFHVDLSIAFILIIYMYFICINKSCLDFSFISQPIWIWSSILELIWCKLITILHIVCYIN